MSNSSEGARKAAPVQTCVQWFAEKRAELDATHLGQAEFLFAAAKVWNHWTLTVEGIEHVTDAGLALTAAQFTAGIHAANHLFG